MRNLSIITTFLLALAAAGTPTSLSQARASSQDNNNKNNISLPLFAELEELSRIVDISYCVGTTGIAHPFLCASRCDEFPNFELVDTFHTGPLMSDSCGYIVLDHGVKGRGREKGGRIIVAFRGTYSLANTIVDLSTVPQEYVPYPGDPANETTTHDGDGNGGGRGRGRRWRWWRWRPWGRKSQVAMLKGKGEEKPVERKCTNCTVHMGFWTSWENTRPFVVPHVKAMKEKYPDYRVHLVGHSLGGAVAALAGLEFDALGWKPTITTFGEPRIGNKGLRNFLDQTFAVPNDHDGEGKLRAGRYRRMTHVDDPVPLLPLQEWGYRQHAGEIFIAKAALQPSLSDLHLCYGDDDLDCIAGADVDGDSVADALTLNCETLNDEQMDEELKELGKRWGIPIPSRYKMWQLFFAHRDYFWRLGLCVPGGDPYDWGRGRYDFGDGDQKPQGKTDL
jgi:pimeloyl-ACP methyl ester carboxylesterase